MKWGYHFWLFSVRNTPDSWVSSECQVPTQEGRVGPDPHKKSIDKSGIEPGSNCFRNEGIIYPEN